MKYNPSDHNAYLIKLNYQEREDLLEKLKQMLFWMEDFDKKDPLTRTEEDKKMYEEKASESALLSNQLSQHALIACNQLGYLLIDTMQVMEIAMDVDPDDDEKYYAYRELKRSYRKFMRAFREDFKKN
jgi:hypothetical protein